MRAISALEATPRWLRASITRRRLASRRDCSPPAVKWTSPPGGGTYFAAGRFVKSPNELPCVKGLFCSRTAEWRRAEGRGQGRSPAIPPFRHSAVLAPETAPHASRRGAPLGELRRDESRPDGAGGEHRHRPGDL